MTVLTSTNKVFLCAVQNLHFWARIPLTSALKISIIAHPRYINQLNSEVFFSFFLVTDNDSAIIIIQPVVRLTN